MVDQTDTPITHPAPRSNAVLPIPLDIPNRTALKTGGFILFGTVALASGVATITNTRIQGSSIAVASYVAPAGTMGANLKTTIAQGSLTITAIKTDKTTETSDTSTVSYFIVL